MSGASSDIRRNGARPGGIISIEAGLSEEARDRIKEAAKQFTGADFVPATAAVRSLRTFAAPRPPSTTDRAGRT